MNRKVLAFAVLCIFACLIYALFNKDIITSSKIISKDIYHSTVTSGQVISKDYNKDLKNMHIINLKVLSNTTPSGTEVIMIGVKDEMTWNLIEEKRFYFVNYQWKNSEIPQLWQIEHNDKFGEIHKDKFFD